ncbi:MAG: AMP-binding protein, partial [Halothiobacillaceae bacterium]
MKSTKDAPDQFENESVLSDRMAQGGKQRSDLLLHELFEVQALHSPQAIALVDSGVTLTYGDLDRRTNRFAHMLCTLGAKPNTLVAIVLDGGTPFVEAILAALKCGSGYLPLDPTQPVARLSALLDDAQPLLLITTTEIANAIQDCSVFKLCVDDLTTLQNLASQPEAPLQPRQLGLTTDSIGYVIYTSVSTGTPKGVVMPQGPLL